MTLLTIYALFFDDIRIISFPKSADEVFFTLTLIVMITFTLEIIVSSYANPKYLFSFFFWLDIISTLSMIPECGWIWNPIVDGST